MTRYFMRDTPLYQMEQMMMTPPHFKPRGHGLRRPTFHYPIGQGRRVHEVHRHP